MEDAKYSNYCCRTLWVSEANKSEQILGVADDHAHQEEMKCIPSSSASHPSLQLAVFKPFIFTKERKKQIHQYKSKSIFLSF